MDTDITTRETCASDPGDAPIYSPEWWRRRTSEELRDLINRGFAGGDLFAGAAAEAARRSDEARHVAEAEAVRVSTLQRRSIRKRRILLLLVGASLIATFLTVVVVFTQVGMS